MKKMAKDLETVNTGGSDYVSGVKLDQVNSFNDTSAERSKQACLRLMEQLA